MDTENNKREYPPQRIAAASIFGIMAGAFVGSAMSSIQPGQDWPQWVIWFLVVGGILCFTALIILVPVAWWKRIWQSIVGFPSYLRETYIWHKYGPKCTIETPVVDYELYPDNNERRYSTKVVLSIKVSEKARNYYPIRCDLSDIKFVLHQKQGLMPVRHLLERNLLLETKILRNTPGNTSHWIGLHWFPYNNPDSVFLDVYRRYRWTITDVHVYMGNLHKRRKITKTGWAVNAQKT